jgi:hypothetical protein
MVIGILQNKQLDSSKKDASAKDRIHRINDPANLLNDMISDLDLHSLVDSDSTSSRAQAFYHVNDNDKTIQLHMPKMLIVESRVLETTGTVGRRYPVLDGTLGGFLKDLKYRITVLGSLKKAMDQVRDQMLELGGINDVDKRVASVKVAVIGIQSFGSSFKKTLISDKEKFLTKEQKKEFEEIESLYIPVAIRNLSGQFAQKN